MENTKIQLPTISFQSYQLLIKSLRYYRNSSIEFIIDADLTTGLSEIIDYLDEQHQIVQLPTY